MAEPTKVDDLLLRYEDARARGAVVSGEELCRDCPELLEEFQRGLRELGSIDALLRAGAVEAAAPVPASLPRIPGCEVLAEVGRGAMGVVYKARQTALKRFVALKMVLAGEYATPRQRARFRTEAEAAARLQHPNIVQVYEVGEHDGRPFLLLEYVDGGSLAQQLNGTPLPPRQAATLVAALARAVHYAHQRGVVHRDLKPGNVLLAISDQQSAVSERELSVESCLRNPVVKISDFGLAKQLEDSGQTSTGAVLGTPSYMPPEQAEGRIKEVGPAADVYALGAILYEVLTGRPPFRGATPLETLDQVRSHEPVPPSVLQHRLPRDLSTICLKCLQKEPARRYATAEALADDLGHFLAGEPILARSVGRVGRLWRWCRRNPMTAALSAAVIAMLLLAAVSGSLGAIHMALLADQEGSARADAERHLLHARELLSGSIRDKGLVLLEARNPLGLLDLVEARRQAEELAGPRQSCSLLWTGWHAAHAGRLLQVVGHSRSVTNVAISPDGKLLVTASGDGTGQLWNTATGLPQGKPIPLHPMNDGNGDILFSPDGKLLSFLSPERTPQLWESATLKPHAKVIPHQGESRKGVFSPSGKWLVYWAGDNTVRLWEIATGRSLASPFPCSSAPAVLVFSPDEQLLAFNCGGQNELVETWQPATMKRCVLFPGHRKKVYAMAFSPDGKRLATGSWDHTARLWDPATGKPLSDPLPHDEDVHAVAFSPDGKLLATASFDGSARLWDTATGQPHGPALRHDGPVIRLAFSPDGRLLATGSFDTTVRLWNPQTGQPQGWPLRHQGVITSVSFSKDGRLLATSSADGTARLWRVHAGEPKVFPHQDRVWAVAFSPNGKHLATGSEDGRAHVWDIHALEHPLYSFLHPNLPNPERPSQVLSLAYSPDGKFLATASPPTVQIWHSATGKPAGQPFEHSFVRVVTFSPDGKWLATTGGGTRAGSVMTRLWETKSQQPYGQEMFQPCGSQPWYAAAFSPDGKWLATGTYANDVYLWDPVTTKAIHPPLPHSGAVEALAFSPDGQLLATAARDSTIRLWETGTWKPWGQPIPQPAYVQALAFSPDSKLLATASADGTARLLDVATGLACGPAMRHQGFATSVAFSPDGKWLATGSFDKTARVWPVPAPIWDIRQIELRTWLALGARLNKDGIVEAIPWKEWQTLRAELRAMEAVGE